MKKGSLLILILLFNFIAKAQFSHQVGASMFFATPKGYKSTSAWGITYYPKISFDNVSIGAPLSLGFSGSADSRSGVTSGSSLTYMLPISVDYNFGLGSVEDDNSNGGFGGYLGVGYGIFSTSYVGDLYVTSIKTSGPLGRAGIRFLIKDHIFDLGASYMQGVSTTNASVIGVSLLYKF